MVRKNIGKQYQFKTRNLIDKLRRFSRELETTAVQLENLGKDTRRRCDNCGTADLRMRIDGTYFCRLCGKDTRKKKKELTSFTHKTQNAGNGKVNKNGNV